MRSVSFSRQNWVFDDNDRFIGLRTGGDFCTEHEMGIQTILDALIPPRKSRVGLDRFLIESMHPALSWVSESGMEGIVFMFSGDPKAKIRHHKKMVRSGDQPLVAWDDRSFMIVVPKTGAEKYLNGLKDLWQAFNRKDVLMGGPFSDHFQGGGIGLFIASAMPTDEMDTAQAKIAEDLRVELLLEEGEKRDGLETIKTQLTKQGKGWFCLKAHRLNDDGSISYWLNPADQQFNYFGSVSIQDLRDWLDDKGKIPGGGRA